MCRRHFCRSHKHYGFPNYLGKITFHEFHHIYQSSFYRNNPDGHREQPTWILEGMAETYGMLEAIKSGWTDNVYFEQTLENARQRIARNPDFADLSIFQDEFGDHWPVHSTEIGMVAVDYIMKNYVGSQSFDQFAYALYSGSNQNRWRNQITTIVGKDYDEFFIELKNYLLN